MNLYGKVILVIDSVSYHKSKKTLKFYEENKDRLKVIYLPKYSPKMNPTEQVWRKMNKWLATRIWFTKM
jgi:transposase